MKKTLLLPALLMMASSAFAETDVVTLDLTKAASTLEFDADNGMWSQTYAEDEITLDSQLFTFMKGAIAAYQTWWGFTASNSADNSVKTEWLTYQFSNMAKGGIELGEDGLPKKNESGAPVVSAAVPYVVGYYSLYNGERSCNLVMNDGLAHEAVGVYINLNSYTFYDLVCGDGFARAFVDGDKLTMTIHGVAEDESEKTVEVTLGECVNGMLSVSRGWTYVDLSPLGAVNEIYFTLDSTDSGVYGANTPLYFCLDKLMVKKEAAGAALTQAARRTNIAYDRGSASVTLTGADFAMVYDMTGALVMSADSAGFSLAGLGSGVYLIKAGDARLKVVR